MVRRILLITLVMLLPAGCGTGETQPIVVGEPSPPSKIVNQASPSPAPIPPTVASTTTVTVPLSPPASTTAAPSPPTSWDPALDVLTPAPDAHVRERQVRFEGIAEPGAVLTAAGLYEVPIGPDGNWSIVLFLNPGWNVATFSAEDSLGNLTEVRLPVYYCPPLVLHGNGLGEAAFGDAEETVAAMLADVLGAPNRDKVVTLADVQERYPDEVSLFTVFGYPAREYARFLSWKRPQLTVMFSDEPLDSGDPAGPVFNGWILSGSGEHGPTLVTSGGISVGSTVVEITDAHGSDVTLSGEPDDCTGNWGFSIGSTDDTSTLRGLLEGGADDPTSTVTRLGAGFGFDEC